MSHLGERPYDYVIAQLRVADVSILPTSTSGNTDASTTTIAATVADDVLAA